MAGLGTISMQAANDAVEIRSQRFVAWTRFHPPASHNIRSRLVHSGPGKTSGRPKSRLLQQPLGLAVRRMHLTMRPDSALRTRDGRIVDDAIAIHREIDHAIGRLKEVR
jgi:hypothetical protein